MEVIPWCVAKGSISQKSDDGPSRDPHFYCTFWNSGETEFLWVPQLGAPTTPSQQGPTSTEIDG
jgi:hypothetical protein